MSKQYKVFDLHGRDDVAQSQLNILLRDGWQVVCCIDVGRIILRNFDDDGNVREVH